MADVKKKKAINTKELTQLTSDFCKLYNLDLATEEATKDKKVAEGKLVIKLKTILDKYEG